MQRVTITPVHTTAHATLVDWTASAIETVQVEASKLAATAGISTLPIAIRITDRFTSDVEDRRGLSGDYTTERVGGVVAAIALKSQGAEAGRLVLVNSTAFEGQDTWSFVRLRYTLGHEVAHCLIDECRRVHGAPTGYDPTPMNLLDTIGYTAVSVSDEFIADELAKGLLPAVNLTIDDEGVSITATDRALLAVDRLNGMTEDLDLHVYPGLRNTVERYRRSIVDLDTMTTALVSGIQGALILGAHYRSACRELSPDAGDVRKVDEHPGTRLYLAPFWARLAPCLDSRSGARALGDFKNADQTAFNVGSDAVTEIWRTLGIRFELLEDDAVHMHVEEPADLQSGTC